MCEPGLLKYVARFCYEKFVWCCIDSILLIEDFGNGTRRSVKFTTVIGNAFFVFSSDSWKGKPSTPITPRAVFIFWLQYFLSEPNTLTEDPALSLKNTSALILYFSSTLV